MKYLKNILWIVSTCILCSCASPKHETMMEGKFKPTWESLSHYNQAPDWFRDAKFGIWAHWGPQCQPEAGDWYARGMYLEGGGQSNYHREKYGHPSEFGFKDVINEWKAEKWDPEKLMDVYKRVGAKYFVALANHHDNLDLWDSKYHNWNSVNMGPKRDIVGEWKKAAEARGLRFGVSVHSAHAWTWYEPSQRSDREGPMKGVPYDGKLTKADGKGKWWEGYDPQELYCQNHDPGRYSLTDDGAIHKHWRWVEGASLPDEAYVQDFLDRNLDLINNYSPDLVYYDDMHMPLWPISDVGLKIASHLYNKSIYDHEGRNEAVMTAKELALDEKDCLVWDVEMGAPGEIQEKPWQTCSCIGWWHYDRARYEQGDYKSAATVVRMLVDIVSKNGNLLLSVPLRGDGTFDEKEEVVLNGIADWMAINGEAIYGTRPWRIYGEGPNGSRKWDGGFNEDNHQDKTAQDIRFVTKGDTLYAHVMAWPEAGETSILIRSLAKGNELYPNEVESIELLGHNGTLTFTRTDEGLQVELPKGIKFNDISFALRIVPMK